MGSGTGGQPLPGAGRKLGGELCEVPGARLVPAGRACDAVDVAGRDVRDGVAVVIGRADSDVHTGVRVGLDEPVAGGFVGDGRDCTTLVQPATATASRPIPPAMRPRRDGFTGTTAGYPVRDRQITPALTRDGMLTHLVGGLGGRASIAGSPFGPLTLWYP